MKFSSRKLIVLTCASLTVLLTACSSSTGSTVTTAPAETTIAKTMQDLPNELINANIFKDQMDQTNYIEMLLGISESEYSSATLYVGSGATSERFAIFNTTSQAMSDAIKSKCESHLAEIKANYASYMPDEVDKIEHAILMANDQYVVLCVADQYNNAKSIIEEYFK